MSLVDDNGNCSMTTILELPFHLSNVLAELAERTGGTPHITGIHSVVQTGHDTSTLFVDVCPTCCPGYETLVIQLEGTGFSCTQIEQALSLNENETRH
jgi:hypothetical protein